MAPGVVAGIVCVAFVLVELLVLDARVRDYDEGVYWQSIAAIARGEPLFTSVFASQPPGFYYALLPFYLLGHSIVSMRLAVLAFGLVGLGGSYLAGRLIGGPIAGLIALFLAATSPLYVHQSAIVQADGPSVAGSMMAVALALVAVRSDGRAGLACAAFAGLVFAFAVGIKLVGVVAAIPIALVVLGAPRRRLSLIVAVLGGAIVGVAVVLIPAMAAPGAAFDQLVLAHLRAGQATGQSVGANALVLFLHREEPLEALALIGVVVALLRRNVSIVMPVVWAAASVLAVLFYHPLFPHHVVMLSLAFALTAAVGLSSKPRPAVPQRERELFDLTAGALVLATAVAGIAVVAGDIRLARVPDLHNAEMIAAVQSTGVADDVWISDNPYAVGAAGRSIPGPLVDTSGQRIRAGLLTVLDLEATRQRYRVRWVLEDSFRLYAVPNYQGWLAAHFHAVRQLGGSAVIYQTN
ncbi:MAG TPA: glycosyltransferase family 39 protein [Candidatus Acidoferrum sp.]|nr:glycosyltransferase family 39 protein [Candidatus Acidoferrum sp.]